MELAGAGNRQTARILRISSGRLRVRGNEYCRENRLEGRSLWICAGRGSGRGLNCGADFTIIKAKINLT
jgi:hypothetical protein